MSSTTPPEKKCFHGLTLGSINMKRSAVAYFFERKMHSVAHHALVTPPPPPRAFLAHRPPPATLSFRYSVYSYGGGGRNKKSTRHHRNVESGTSSRARESIRESASYFVDLYSSGHGESVERIRADGVDILVDLQGHTLRGRGEITAARPARLQVHGLEELQDCRSRCESLVFEPTAARK